MSSVKRYNIRELQHPADIATLDVVYKNAECVLASDYDALTARCAELEAALQQIVEVHGMYCEHHVGVSNISYELTAIAQAALETGEKP